MKKLITSVILSTALIGGACALTGCNKNTSNTSASLGDRVHTTDQFYSYGCASVGSIISSANAKTSATTFSSKVDLRLRDGQEPSAPATDTQTPPATTPDTTPEAKPQGAPASSELTDEQLQTVNNYMGLVENLLGENNLTNTKTQSDREGYEVKEVVSYGDLNGNTITYTMYYNSVLQNREEENDDDETEVEEQYSISGIMIIDEVEYALEGHNEVETSATESESESYFKVTIADGSYVIMEQELEEGETSLVYEVVQDGKRVERTKFEYETEVGETELMMSIEKDGSKSVLRFSDEVEQNVRVIKVTSVENQNRISFKIFITKDENGNDVYRYTFGEKVKDMHKNHQEKSHGKR